MSFTDPKAYRYRKDKYKVRRVPDPTDIDTSVVPSVELDQQARTLSLECNNNDAYLSVSNSGMKICASKHSIK